MFRQLTHLLIVILLAQAPQSYVAFAEENPFQKEEAEIPKAPSAPPAFSRRIPEDPYPCHRKIAYKGKVISCDSNMGRDADRLKEIVKGVPEAESEIDIYQSNRNKVEKLAYVGTAGLLIYIAGKIISNTSMQTSNGGYTNAGNQLRTLTQWGGLGITAGALGIGLTTLHRNDQHIENAIQKHNEARPNTPIEIQFSTGFTF